MTETAIIAGFGTGSRFSLELAKALLTADYRVAAFVRSEEKAGYIAEAFGTEQRIRAYVADLLDAANVGSALDRIEQDLGPVDVYIHNAARLVTGRFVETDANAYRDAWHANVATAIVAGRPIIERLVERQRGVAIFTGATASQRGAAGFGPFAAAKFALRGFAQSLARELGPMGIHVAHVLVDGVIWGDRAEFQFQMQRSDCIEPAALAELYLQLIAQPASCWTHEIDVRPSKEKF